MGFGRLVFYSFLVLLAGFLQHSPVFSVFGVRPDFVLVLLLTLSFVIDKFPAYLWLVVLGLFCLKFQSGFDGSLLGIGLFSVAAFWLGREMPSLWILNNTILVSAATLVSYLLAKPSFILSNWLVVVAEILYNLIIGSLMFLAFSANERRSKF